MAESLVASEKSSEENLTRKVKPAARNDEKRQAGEDLVLPVEGATAALDVTLQRPKLQQTSSKHSASLQKPHSYGDGHRYTRFGQDEKNTVEASEGQNSGEKQFEVQWDEDGDPMNPRRMSEAHKWIIVFIVSAGSTCVYGSMITALGFRN